MQQIGRGFIKTEGWEKVIAFLSCQTEGIWKLMQQYKRFQIIIDYDAEALNTYIKFYSDEEITEKSDEAGSTQGDPES